MPRPPTSPPAVPCTPLAFPPADSGYHDYAEMVAEINALVAAKPAIAQKLSIGTSYEGRDMPLIKISDNVATDENEPEILFNAHQHAREHLTVEMALYILHLLIDGYGTDTRITNLVNSREFWIVPDMNPDGGEYDIATGTYRSWRKNRQPNAGSSNVGTDLNRNWSYQWGCCGGSSGHAPSSETYRGPSAFSAPETQRLRNFVNSRVIGGAQQIKAHIDWHTYSQLVLWPYGYTTANTTGNLGADAQSAFATLGQADGGHQRLHPGAGQRPLHRRRHDHRLDVGDPRHLLLHHRDVPGPRPARGGGFYPPDEQIVPQTTRNREAVLLFSRVRRLRLPHHRQAGPVLRRRRRHDRLLRHLRDRDRLDDQPERHRHRHHRRVGARRPRHTNSSGRQAARHHGQRHQRPGHRAAGRRRPRATSTSTAA